MRKSPPCLSLNHSISFNFEPRGRDSKLFNIIQFRAKRARRWQKVTSKGIEQALNEALSRREECAGLAVARIFETDGGPSNWDAEIDGKDGKVIDPECKRVMLATKLGIQNRFELAADALDSFA